MIHPHLKIVSPHLKLNWFWVVCLIWMTNGAENFPSSRSRKMRKLAVTFLPKISGL